MPDPIPQDASVVRTVASAPSDPVAQEVAIQQGRGTYSHGKILPLELSLERTGWFSRAISVTTTETVWYRDAVTYIKVPAPFTYDLASIPSLVWFIVSPWDVALESLFHDMLYREQIVRRRVADQTMLSMMEDRGVPYLIRLTVYFGVRIGGWVAWKKHAAENRAARIAEQNKAENKPC